VRIGHSLSLSAKDRRGDKATRTSGAEGSFDLRDVASREVHVRGLRAVGDALDAPYTRNHDDRGTLREHPGEHEAMRGHAEPACDRAEMPRAREPLGSVRAAKRRVGEERDRVRRAIREDAVALGGPAGGVPAILDADDGNEG